MPSCPPGPPAGPDDAQIQAVASSLTESTLKRALTQLISEAIDEGPPADSGGDEVEEVARALVCEVLRDAWATFLDTCDLNEWLVQGEEANLSQRMAQDLLQRVTGDEGRRTTGHNHRSTAVGESSSSRPHTKEDVDLDFFQSPREHTNTDTLYPKSGGGDGASTAQGSETESGRRRAPADGRAESGATGGDASCAAGEEIRFRFDNNDCRIDLRSVRPYQGVLGKANCIDEEGNEVSVLLFDSSQLPARSVADYDHLMQQMLLYSLYTVEQHMYSNYSIVYLHGNAPKDHWPRAKWLRQWCHALNSKTTKHLTQLFVVFPTLWIRTLRLISRPFVKFKPAVHFVSSLRSLVAHLPEAEAVIPKAVKESDGSA